MVSYSELTKKTMPPDKEAMEKKDIIVHYVCRPISNIITIPLLETNITATGVTKISCIPLFAALVVFLISSDIHGFLFGLLLVAVWNILDGVNGYVCHEAEEYATRIREAMVDYPQALVDRARADVEETYSTTAMAEKYKCFYGLQAERSVCSA